MSLLDDIEAQSVWKPRPVDEVPTLVLESWSVREITDIVKGEEVKSRHFVGYNLTEYEGRVSSAIVNYDPETKTGVTRSGRQYVLEGSPGMNMDAEHTWGYWKRINSVTDNWADVSDEYR